VQSRRQDERQKAPDRDSLVSAKELAQLSEGAAVDGLEDGAGRRAAERPAGEDQRATRSGRTSAISGNRIKERDHDQERDDEGGGAEHGAGRGRGRPGPRTG
jgi:hypothetical protein